MSTIFVIKESDGFADFYHETNFRAFKTKADAEEYIRNFNEYQEKLNSLNKMKDGVYYSENRRSLTVDEIPFHDSYSDDLIKNITMEDLLVKEYIGLVLLSIQNSKFNEWEDSIFIKNDNLAYFINEVFDGEESVYWLCKMSSISTTPVCEILFKADRISLVLEYFGKYNA